LKVLRTLIELQLSHSSEIKKMIDAAWRVARAPPKKKDAANGSDSGPQLEDLQLLPIGQDLKRKRYWIVDGMSLLLSFLAFFSRRPCLVPRALIFL